MRFAAYAGTSVVLAAGTVLRAFFERPNFYAASVLIAQSNACLMILTNVALLGISVTMLGMQRLFYGPLRPIEVEQLYEKAWFAITETCLAMTIFREEVGGWFLVMFVSLLVGKVWGWIGEGRVEILEQQPPTNPRLFHAQLSVSLLLSSLFDGIMLRYAVTTVLRHARPNMMVMFAFEFAVLTVTSFSTAARYGISVYEASVIRSQIAARRAQVLRQRADAHTSSASEEEYHERSLSSNDVQDVQGGDGVDFTEIDTPGWEEKGRWLFYLDLATDLLKLVLYLTFFCVLCMFYGMPIHIIRDVALTIRSFYKRITDFLRYRQATRDMNTRYPDATSEEITREDVCIICREEMRPWVQQTSPSASHVAEDATVGANIPPVDERSRSKKLPCGHILHFACLRSWLERQQNCPTCRRPVLTSESNGQDYNPRLQRPQRAQARLPDHGVHAQAAIPHRPNALAPPPNPRRNVYTLGPLRIAFGAARQDLPVEGNANTAIPTQHGAVRVARPGNITTSPGPLTPASVHSNPTMLTLQLQQIEQQLLQEISSLRLQADQLHHVRALQAELVRLRTNQTTRQTIINSTDNSSGEGLLMTYLEDQSFISERASQDLQAAAPGIPGLILPQGWTLMPLRRLTTVRQQDGREGSNLHTHSGWGGTQHAESNSRTQESYHGSTHASSLHPADSETYQNGIDRDQLSSASRVAAPAQQSRTDVTFDTRNETGAQVVGLSSSGETSSALTSQPASSPGQRGRPFEKADRGDLSRHARGDPDVIDDISRGNCDNANIANGKNKGATVEEEVDHGV